MYKLYYSPGACSKAPHVLLHDIGAEHEAVRVALHDPSGAKDPQLLAVNPRHIVPVLDDDGEIIREGAAIIIYLADKHKSDLLPQSGAARARALEWLCYFNASMHPVYGSCFSVGKVYNDKNISDAIIAKLQPKLQAMWNDVDQHLAKNKYVAGDQLTIGDILMTVFTQWKVPGFQTQVNPGVNVMRVVNEVKALPSWKAATEMEASEHKQAA